MMDDDVDLLAEYRRNRSEPAFAELVRRHIDLVYATALRTLAGDCHLAEDVTQVVFADLARKAWQVPADAVLAGWLHRHATFTASKAVRTERRRRAREQAAHAMNAPTTSPEPDWEQIAPFLDASLNQLSASDRDALVLRFLQQRDFRAIGATLGISEDAAQKRVSRALDKLRGVLSRRGVALGGAALASALTAGAVTAAPAGLALTVTTGSLVASASMGTGFYVTLTKLMAVTKLQIGIASVVLAAGLATPLALQHQTLNRVRAENAQLLQANQALQAQTAQIAALTGLNQRLSNRLAALTVPPPTAAATRPSAEELQLRSRVTQLQSRMAQLQAQPGAATNLSGVLTDMFKSPEMKDYMKNVMGRAINEEYGPLITNLNLTAEQTAAFKDALKQTQASNFDRNLSVTTDDATGTNALALWKQLTGNQNAMDSQIKQLLGESNFAQFKAYQGTLPQRSAVNEFSQQLAPGDALTSAQAEQLIQAMSEERSQFKSSVLGGDSPPNGVLVKALSPADRETYLQEQAQLDQKYATRAQQMLSAAQFTAFQDFLQKQEAFKRMDIQMSQKMLSPNGRAQ